MNTYPPYYCDVIADKVVEIKKSIDLLKVQSHQARDRIKEIDDVLIPDLEAKRQHLTDVLHKEGLPLQAL
jgi:hypothetical protein